MELEDLLFDSSNETANRAAILVGENPEHFKTMLDFALLDKPKFAMRAMRVINLVTDKNPILLEPFIPEIAKSLSNYRTIGLKRGIAKIFSEQDYDYDEDTAGHLVHICFNWLNDPAEAIALKIYSMTILYMISNAYPGIKPELISSIENEIPKNSAAVVSRGKKLLRKLYKEVKS
jgi:hypothetical protein